MYCICYVHLYRFGQANRIMYNTLCYAKLTKADRFFMLLLLLLSLEFLLYSLCCGVAYSFAQL